MSENLTGSRFGKWFVIGPGEPHVSKNGTKTKTWHCKCDCGTERDVVTQRLLNGRSQSCGDCNKPDLTGQNFFSLRVIRKAKPYIRANGKPVVMWECKCTCGNIVNVSTAKLRSGKYKSCGCQRDYYLRIKNTIHGDSHTRLHNIWSGMRERCYTVTDCHYKWYGERGIKICNEWRNNYVAFKDWALNNGYNASLTIDRIDVNGDYSPDNCRWATMKEQSNNTRRNHIIEAFGERMTLTQWSEKTGIEQTVIRSRLKNGWSIEDALSKPKRKNINGHYVSE